MSNLCKLVARLDRALPIASCVGSRNPRALTSAERCTAQLPEAGVPQQHRPAVVCGALSLGSWDAGRSQDHYPSDAAMLAPGWVSSRLALEIPTARWPAVGTNGYSPLDPRDEHRKPALGRAPDTWGTTSSSASMSDRPRLRSTWQGDGGRHRRAGRPFCAVMPMAPHR